MANTTGKKYGGRTKGTPNKDTRQLRERVNALLEDNWDTILDDFKELEPKDRIGYFTKLLEYSLPKLSRTDTVVSNEEAPKHDLSVLTTDELHTLNKLYDKIRKGNQNIYG